MNRLYARKTPTDGDMVVIIDANEIAELQMTSQGSCLACNTFHSTSITKETVCVIVHHLEALLVEHTTSMRLTHSQTNSIAKTLTKRPGGHFDTRGVMGFGMTRCYAVHLSEVLEIVHGDLVAEEMKEGILKHASVAVRKHKAISVEPAGILRVEGHELVEENMGHWGHAHGCARMAGVRLKGGIDLE